MPDWLHIVIRSFSFLIVLFLLTKILGKRQISQLSYFEYITGITVGSIAAELSFAKEQEFSHGIISIVIWGAFPVLIGFLALKNKKIRDVVEGKATVLIKDGKVMEDNLKKEKYTIDELLELLRKKDIFRLADVEFAVLEPDGNVNALLKKENQPLTPKDIGLRVTNEKEPHTIIMDGEIINEPLADSGYNRAWLHSELDKLGVTVENVFIGQVDTYGELTVDVYDDKLQIAAPQDRPMLLATLKKCQADLELFALQTDSKEAKQLYLRNAQKMEKILKKAKHLLLQ